MSSLRLHSYTILVADDEPANMEVILDFLGDGPEEILYAPNGKRACELALSDQPDLIIMDWEMPVMNGLEAITQLKQDTRTADIPVIVATGVMTQSLDLKTALETGAVDFIRKPFDPIELDARIRGALRLSESYLEIKRQNEQIKQQNQQIIDLTEKEKQHLKETIDSKERELSSSALFEFQKNELLSNLMKEMERLDVVTNRLYAPDIRKITKQLKAATDLEKSWTNFKLHFDEVHPSFFVELSKKFPELTNNEQRTCAYLRIGLGNKEIALLTNVESGSVRKSLTRLKKKLNLSFEEDLREFIGTI